MVQWLGLRAFTFRAQVQILIGELRSCKLCNIAKKKKKKEIEGRGAANLAESEEPELTSLHRHTKTTTIYKETIDGKG